MPWALDLDGVMWLGDQPIAGSAEAVEFLRSRDEQVLFVTNNSSEPLEAVEAKLARYGVDAIGDVVTSALAGAAMVEPGERVLAVAGLGVVEALEQRGAVVITDPHDAGATDVEVVMVGFTRTFTYDHLAAANQAVRAGARLIGTNSDPTYPTPEGQVPGGGAILAAVVAATSVEPMVAGKPHAPMVRLVRDRLGPLGVMVGDRPDTDGWFAQALGYRFALVHSGVTDRGPEMIDPPPDLVGADLAEVVRAAWL
jgi:HAD superfamily hydrolase (TIGR01450 family)